MQVKVLIFGQLTDITGVSEIYVDNLPDTDEVIKSLIRDFPALRDSKFAVAVDKKVVSQNITLSDGCTVALLPPFSGG